MKSHATFILLMATAYITSIGVAIPIFGILPSGDAQWIALALFLIFNFFVTVAYLYRNRQWFIHLAIAAEASCILGLCLLSPAVCDNAVILLFVISSCATLLLPIRPALAWIVSLYFTSLFALAFTFGWTETLGYLSAAGGHMLFGGFGYLLRQNTAARLHTEQLLEDLRTAHRQLQEYTTQAQRLAVAEERNRLAREMHDALGHRLTVAVLQLEGAQRLIPTDPERAATMVGAMREQVKEALADVRKTVTALRTEEQTASVSNTTTPSLPAATAHSLTTDLTNLIATFQEATGLPIKTTLPATLPPLASSQRLALYRAAQELLTNVQRHAEATHAALSLTVAPEQIVLTVTDNGIGMPMQVEDGRFGLRGLAERAQQLGGSFTLAPGAEGGVMATFQIEQQGAPAPVQSNGRVYG
ncbi:MAG: sensor histidine kinase [Caldilineaceae bacterium]